MADNTKTGVSRKPLQVEHSATAAELERYRLLVENVQDYAIFFLDKNGFVATWNRGARKIKQYKASEIIGKHFSTFYLKRDVMAEKPKRELELATRFGRVEDEDWRVRKDGSQFWANVVITALRDDSGELVGFAKVTRDLTERKQHEDDLRRANDILREQQRELERLNLTKDEFISLASHQLRTPATGVKQFLGMLIEGFVGDVDSTQLEYISKAYESNEHQIEIVNNLLKVAQIDAGKVVLHKSNADVRKLINGVVEEHAERFKRRQQKVSVDVHLDSPFVSVDVGHFRMVLENLIDNASKYTPDGGKIVVSARANANSLRISIEDTGVGIAAKDVDKLFEKFTRIPNLLSDSVGGSGLGLYWVNKVIALHGGRIEVRSKLHKGTTFHVYVPLGQVGA